MNNDQLHKRITKLVHTGQHEEAFRVVKKLSLKNPGNPVVWYLLAGLHANSGNIDEMISCCKKVIQLDPEHAAAHFNLGAAYHQVGRYDDSLSAYQHCIDIEPENAIALNGLGRLYLSMREFKSARKCFLKLLQSSPEDLQLLINLGRSHSGENNHTEARSFYSRALAANPGSAEAGYLLGNAWQSSGDHARAVDAYRNALAIQPDYPEALNNMGHALTELGQLHDAENIFLKMIAISPDSTEAHNNLGVVYDSMGDFKNAEHHYRNAISLSPSFIDAYCHLGYMLANEGMADEALELFDSALSQSPGYETAIAGKAATLERLGKFEEAASVIEPAIAERPLNPDVVLAYCRIALRLGNFDQAIDLASSILSANNLPEKGKSDINRILGDLYDRKNDPEPAFRHYALANSFSPGTWQQAKHVSYIDKIIKYTDRKALSLLPRAPHIHNNIVFIVGMPRSGTSLVEQILASHPEVFGAGELRFIGEFASSEYLMQKCGSTYPEAIAKLGQTNVDHLAQKYSHAIKQLAPDSRVITDKMPHNFIYLGLIALLLPGAKIVHIRRNPLDNCLSLYFQGFNPMHSYSTDLSMLGKYYTQYSRLMGHWKTELDIPILDICYEDIIKDAEGCTRKLLKFCGLSWSRECLDFHKNRRFVKTPSYDQVRQPIYSSSVDRWQKYREFIGPLKKALEDDA